ncbi:MAG: histidine-type phosphatase, partial [Prevotella sp.]|nr:histidine-type phosphatase [Prevotella sp.]
MKKNLFVALVATLLSTFILHPSSMTAQSPREEFKQNIFKSGSNYYAYPGPEQQTLTPAPKGYTPYYMSHYGRHGSR